jgi:4-hydroxy-L-threonine phosphate dehydrogenase PdxA
LSQRRTGEKPLIAVAIGDPSGVGPEVTVKSLQTREPQQRGTVLLIGNVDGLEDAAKLTNSDLCFVRVRNPAEARELLGDVVPVYDDSAVSLSEYRVGQPSAAGGRATLGWIRKAMEWAAAGDVDGFIIAPIDNASFNLAGITDLSEEMHPKGSFLLRAAGKLRFIPIGEHVMIRDLPAMVTTERVLHVIVLIGEQLQKWGLPSPRIAVAGLNPHAAGVEDAEQIAPAVIEARRLGFDVTGPLSPDTVFRRASLGQFDVVVAMYHDQGQIAIKTTSMEEACAIFVGLPYVRVGVPHGSALDIAGKGIAQSGTMLTALTTACMLASGGWLMKLSLVNKEDRMTEKLLPDGFADLEPLVGEWCLGTEKERCNKRLTTEMAKLKSFYNVAFPRLDAIIAHLNDFPNDPAKLPADASRLYELALMVMEAAAPIDLGWATGDIADSFPIERLEFIEPQPVR